MNNANTSPSVQALRWNAGGWFGCQLGATCWLAICAVLLLAHGAASGLAALLVFAVLNLIGLALWTMRARISIRTALLCFLPASLAGSLLAVWSITVAGEWHLVSGVDLGGGSGTVSSSAMIPVLIIVHAALFALFWFRKSR